MTSATGTSTSPLLSSPISHLPTHPLPTGSTETSAPPVYSTEAPPVAATAPGTTETAAEEKERLRAQEASLAPLDRATTNGNGFDDDEDDLFPPEYLATLGSEDGKAHSFHIYKVKGPFSNDYFITDDNKDKENPTHYVHIEKSSLTSKWVLTLHSTSITGPLLATITRVKAKIGSDYSVTLPNSISTELKPLVVSPPTTFQQPIYFERQPVWDFKSFTDGRTYRWVEPTDSGKEDAITCEDPKTHQPWAQFRKSRLATKKKGQLRIHAGLKDQGMHLFLATGLAVAELRQKKF